MEKDADCRRPKNDVEEGQHHPEKKGRNPDKQGQKGAVFRFPIGCQHNLTKVGGDWGGRKSRPYGGETDVFFFIAGKRSIRETAMRVAGAPAQIPFGNKDGAAAPRGWKRPRHWP